MDWDVYLKIGILCAGIFAIQMAICFKAGKVMTKLWPVIILTGLEIVCLLIVILVGFNTDTKAVVSSFAGAQMLLTTALLVPVDLAWLVYGIIWLIKKMINKPEV